MIGTKEIEMKKYGMTWDNKFLTSESKTFEEMELALKAAASHLSEMRESGCILDPSSSEDDYMHIYTHDPKVAEHFGMIEDDFDGEEDNFEEDDDSEDESISDD